MNPMPTRVVGGIAVAIAALAGSACGRAGEPAAPPSVNEQVDAVLRYPPGWNELNNRSIELFQKGQVIESIALLEAFAAEHPDFGEVYYSLGDSHSLVARGLTDYKPTSPADTDAHFEAAARNLKRAFDVWTDPDDKIMAALQVLDVCDERAWNHPADAEPVARDLIRLEPGRARGYDKLAGALRRLDRQEEAMTMLLEAAPAIAPDQQPDYAEALVTHALLAEALPVTSRRALVEKARPTVDGLLAADANSIDGLRIKSTLISAESRLERDPAKKKALEDESRRLFAQSLDILSKKL
jgi:tetratricopeptide (TPR) repeat protein